MIGKAMSVLAILVLNGVILCAQGLICDHSLPEPRYWVESLVLLIPLVPIIARRYRFCRMALIVTAVVLGAYNLGFMLKAQIPGSRRNCRVRACHWAAEYIKSDYTGPESDRPPSVFSIREYQKVGRPVVDAHIPIVPYLIGGRNSYELELGEVDIPDYIVEEPHRVDWSHHGVYRIVAEKDFGKYHFNIYKRIK